MASSNNVPNMEDRFSTLNTEVNTQRVMFDVAALPTGTLLGVDERPSDEDDFGENLSRQLFGDPTSSPVNEEAQVTNEQHEVTVESTQHTSINSNEETTEADRLLESLGDGREEVAASLLDFAAAQPEKRRYRFAYAKKFFFASRALYYELKPSLPPPDDFPELLGQIKTTTRTIKTNPTSLK